MRDYLTLLKPRVIWLLILSAVAGYIYASGRSPNPAVLFWVVLVGFLSTGGAAAFNHYWERDIDAKMQRTKNRPLPAGRLKPRNALAFSLALSAAGVALAFLALSVASGMAVAAGWLSYAVLYTMLLKRRTWANVLVGGLAGNASFLAGHLAARPLDLEGVLLSLAVYLWIPSHIWSLAYARAEEYRAAGVPMLPTVIPRETATRLIAGLNVAAALYMVILAFALGVAVWLVGVPVAVAIYASARTLARSDEKSFWLMFKSSNPILAVFLLALII